jgi:hypothetical protein
MPSDARRDNGAKCLLDEAHKAGIGIGIAQSCLATAATSTTTSVVLSQAKVPSASGASVGTV